MYTKRQKRHMAIVAAAALTTLTAACGARVAPYLPTAVGPGAGQPGATTTLGLGIIPGSATTLPGSKSTPGATTPGTVSGRPGTKSGQGGQTGTGPTTQAAALAPSNFNFNPQAEAAYCSGTAGNTASAPGVTPTSITVGNVSGITGLIPSSFKPGYQAVTAAFDAVNRFGGICGRQLKLAVEDDQQSASNNQADVQDLIPKVLAFVGSLSDGDNGGVNAMVAAGTPDMGPAINTNRSNSPVYWSATGGSVFVKNGHAYIWNTWLNGLRAYHSLPSSIAVLSYSIPISASAGREFANAFQQAGVKLCYSDYSIAAGAQATTIPSDVRQMQAKGCGGVYTTMDVVGNANMLDAMQNDNYHPGLVAVTYEGYTPDQISTAGQQASQGLQVALSSVPLTSNVQGVQLYNQELGIYEPGNPASEFGLSSWADAQMFIYALLKAGRNPTRASLTNALSHITGWTSDHAYGPYTPSTRMGIPCNTDVIVRGNQFVTAWPASGLYCNGQFIDVGPA